MMDGMQDGDLRTGHQDPVQQLMFMGETSFGNPAAWHDYRADPGIGHEHVRALIALACDMALHQADSSASSVWAPLHAWRALAQLRAEAAVAPLLALLELIEGDDAADLELPLVFGMIGQAALPHMAAFMADPESPKWSVATAISGLKEIGARHPGCRGECIDILARTLKPHADTDPITNGFAVSALLDLRGVEAIDTIRAAFHRDAVDISIPGDIEDVEIALGLRDHRATPAPRYQFLAPDWPPFARVDPSLLSDRATPVRREKIGRNARCPCGSGKKYKKCCLQ
jgi:hypothetical protein